MDLYCIIVIILRCVCLLLQDCTISVWDIQSPTAITLRTVLEDQSDFSILAVDMSEINIISGHGDHTIKVQPSFALQLHTSQDIL